MVHTSATGAWYSPKYAVKSCSLASAPLPNAASAQAGKSAPQVAQAVDETRSQAVASANSPQVDEYLMAHQEFSPRTALQGVVPYVRQVSATQDGDRR